MKSIFRAVLLLAVLVSFPGREALADTYHEIKQGNLSRQFRIHLPAGIVNPGKLPVILAFHGGGGDMDYMADLTGLNAISDRHGFMVVYPAGTGGRKDRFLTWNAGPCCGWALEHNIDDVAFVRSLIDTLVGSYNADPRRIYATGISNGAAMSYRLACELPDKIAGIAPVSGERPGFPNCKNGHAVPVIHFHGTVDRCIPYKGGEACGGCFEDFLASMGIFMKKKPWVCEAIPLSVSKAAGANGCTGYKIEKFLGQGDTSCVRYAGCPPGGDVALCTVYGGGHQWPGLASPPKICVKRPNGRICRKWNEQVGRAMPILIRVMTAKLLNIAAALLRYLLKACGTCFIFFKRNTVYDLSMYPKC